MKNHKQTWQLVLLTMIPVAVLAFVPTFRVIWKIPTQQARRDACQANLHQLSMALAEYSQDFDNKFPLVSTQGSSGGNWDTVVQPYGHSFTMYRCPVDSSRVKITPTKQFHNSFWMNGNLSGKSISKLLSPTSTLLLGDGEESSDTTYSKTALPPTWLQDEKSPAQRHLGGANYAMADGSIHWLHPDEVATFGGRTNAFSLR